MFGSVIGEHVVEVMIWVVRVIVVSIEWVMDVMWNLVVFTVLMMLWMSIRVSEVLMAILDMLPTVNAIVILIGISVLIEVMLAL